MKDYNFSNNYENVDSWSIEKDIISDASELSFGDKLFNLFSSYPNLLNSLKTKKVLYFPPLVILAGVGIIEFISLFSIINIKRLESKHYEYEEKVNSLNDINVTVDDIKVVANERLTYKGMMLSGVQNFAISFGYVNASWTLRADLTCEYVCRLINLMEKKGVKCCEPIDDKSAYGDDQLIDFTSGYFERGLNQMPRQGNKSPWKNYQNYLKDIFAVRLFSIKDSNLNFYSSKE